VLCDSHGNSIHLGERDCSTQRRYQKLIEESPAPGLRPEVRKAMHESALKLVRGMNYVSCGTIEYLVDAATQDFYFIEMNTRLQVEHPVTEMVTSIDIVKEQIWIAAGRELSFTQDDVKIVGHAIEARINAEDPDTFLPSPGEIVGYHAPGGVGVRVDSAIYDRYRIPPHYDSLIAKIIVRGADREEALIKLVTALEECIIGGIRSNLDLHRRILMHPQFASGAVHTQLLDIILAEEKELAESSAAEEDDEEAKTAVA
ncbi:UNVERIFIED_CONTAM: hypothetical protein GTU68_059184, partial [Idotea baltica]|nr:hypothetical protein [Idotea baltica]